MLFPTIFSLLIITPFGHVFGVKEDDNHGCSSKGNNGEHAVVVGGEQQPHTDQQKLLAMLYNFESGILNKLCAFCESNRMNGKSSKEILCNVVQDMEFDFNRFKNRLDKKIGRNVKNGQQRENGNGNLLTKSIHTFIALNIYLPIVSRLTGGSMSSYTNKLIDSQDWDNMKESIGQMKAEIQKATIDKNVLKLNQLFASKLGALTQADGVKEAAKIMREIAGSSIARAFKKQCNGDRELLDLCLQVLTADLTFCAKDMDNDDGELQKIADECAQFGKKTITP
jgi:hypothetical protein